MIVSITLSNRWIDHNSSVNYQFADGHGLQYSSIDDAETNAVLDENRVASILRDLCVSIAESTNINGPITAIFNNDAPDGAVVRVTI